MVIKVPHLHLHSFEVKCDEQRTNERTNELTNRTESQTMSVISNDCLAEADLHFLAGEVDNGDGMHSAPEKETQSPMDETFKIFFLGTHFQLWKNIPKS